MTLGRVAATVNQTFHL